MNLEQTNEFRTINELSGEFSEDRFNLLVTTDPDHSKQYQC